MSYTNATVIIAAADQAAAQVDFPGTFTSALTDADGATFYVCSGLWADSDLERVVNNVTWPRRLYFGEVQSALHTLGLNPIESSEL